MNDQLVKISKQNLNLNISDWASNFNLVWDFPLNAWKKVEKDSRECTREKWNLKHWPDRPKNEMDKWMGSKVISFDLFWLDQVDRTLARSRVKYGQLQAEFDASTHSTSYNWSIYRRIDRPFFRCILTDCKEWLANVYARRWSARLQATDDDFKIYLIVSLEKTQ